MSTVLFDADGVVQFAGQLYAHFDQRYGWPEQRVNDFFRHLFLERSEYDGSLTGEADLLPVIADALTEWGWDAPADLFVRDWLTLGAVPDRDALALITTLRQRGVRCGLASNQERVRARFMDEELGYRRLFDARFYSAELGYAKPDLAYFHAVLAALDTDPGQILFIDDREENVESARRCGLCGAHYPDGTSLRELLSAYSLPV